MIDPTPSPEETPKPDMDLNDALAELKKGDQPKRRNKKPVPSLSQSQTLAANRLETLFRLKLLGSSAGGISMRTHALLCGPSGAGKTTAVRLFAEQFGLPVLACTVGSWTPWGARHEPNTLDQIGHFVRSNKAGIVLLDEVDKLTSKVAGEQFWSASVTQEIFALFDADERLGATNFSAEDRARLWSSFLIVGAGAWQKMWAEALELDESVRAQVYVEGITEGSGLPDELFFRFAQPLIPIMPPNADELAGFISRMYQSLGIHAPMPKQIADLAECAVKSGRAMRFLEDYATHLLAESTKESSLGDLLKDIEPVKRARSNYHFGETKMESQKRLFAALRTHAKDLEQIGHDVSQVLTRASESDWKSVYRALALDSTDLGEDNDFRFSRRDINELPGADQLDKSLANLPQHQRELLIELKTAFTSIGEAAVSYVSLGDAFLNNRAESRVVSYGGWVAKRLVDLLDGPTNPKLSTRLNELLWKFVRQHRAWLQTYNQMIAAIAF